MSKLNSLKFIYLVVATLALTTSCSKDRNLDSGPQKEITFGNLSTRATVGSADDILQFGVFAQMNLDADDTEEPTNWISLLANEEVSRADASSSWTYDNKRYWINDRTFRFFAYWPYLGENKDAAEDGLWQVEEIADASGNCSYELSFVTPDTADKDLLAARYQTIITADQTVYPTVNLRYEHLLTSVCLKIWREGVKHQNDQMRIKKVTLSNIYKSGTYSSAIGSTGTWTTNNDKLPTFEKVYTKFSDTDDIGAAQVNVDGTLNTGGVEANPFEDMLLIPQTLDASNSVSLKIVYELKRQNAASWEEAELETILPDITWAPNRRYTYNIVLSSVTDITIYYIQTKVDPWGTPQVGGTVIIK